MSLRPPAPVSALLTPERSSRAVAFAMSSSHSSARAGIHANGPWPFDSRRLNTLCRHTKHAAVQVGCAGTAMCCAILSKATSRSCSNIDYKSGRIQSLRIPDVATKKPHLCIRRRCGAAISLCCSHRRMEASSKSNPSCLCKCMHACMHACTDRKATASGVVRGVHCTPGALGAGALYSDGDRGQPTLCKDATIVEDARIP